MNQISQEVLFSLTGRNNKPPQLRWLINITLNVEVKIRLWGQKAYLISICLSHHTIQSNI